MNQIHGKLSRRERSVSKKCARNRDGLSLEGNVKKSKFTNLKEAGVSSPRANMHRYLQKRSYNCCIKIKSLLYKRQRQKYLTLVKEEKEPYYYSVVQNPLSRLQ